MLLTKINKYHKCHVPMRWPTANLISNMKLLLLGDMMCNNGQVRGPLSISAKLDHKCRSLCKISLPSHKSKHWSNCELVICGVRRVSSTRRTAGLRVLCFIIDLLWWAEWNDIGEEERPAGFTAQRAEAAKVLTVCGNAHIALPCTPTESEHTAKTHCCDFG